MDDIVKLLIAEVSQVEQIFDILKIALFEMIESTFW